MFSCEFYEISKNTFFTEPLRANASKGLYYQEIIKLNVHINLNKNTGFRYLHKQLSKILDVTNSASFAFATPKNGVKVLQESWRILQESSTSESSVKLFEKLSIALYAYSLLMYFDLVAMFQQKNTLYSVGLGFKTCEVFFLKTDWFGAMDRSTFKIING